MVWCLVVVDSMVLVLPFTFLLLLFLLLCIIHLFNFYLSLNIQNLFCLLSLSTIQLFMNSLKPNKEEKSINSSLKSSKVSFKQSLLGACTNFVYRIGAIGGIKRVPHLLTKNVQEEHLNVILGRNYASKEEAKKILKNIIWFTYRQKLKIAEDLNSDVGWGCLPRVGQMLLAQALIKARVKKGNEESKEVKAEIIESFLDDQGTNCKYSLNKILKMARMKFALTPGEWFHIGQIAEVLRKLQNETPLEGTEKLKVIFFNQAAIFIEDILKKGGLQKCKCESNIECDYHKISKQKEKQRVLKENEVEQEQELIIPLSKRLSETSEKVEEEFELYYENSNEKESVPSEANLHYLKNELLVIVSVRVATKQIESDEFQALKQLLSLKVSLGIIGGVPRKALYIVGYSNNQFVYLDPHYVQDFVNQQNLNESYHTFFSQEFRTLNRQVIDPSMALAFYLKSVQDIQQLMRKINKLRKEFEKKEKAFFISILESNEYQNKTVKHIGQNESYEFPTSMEYSSLQFRDLTDSP